jgi:light-regulated signal transduction histidine kinase (bacteriophytochrome)
MIDLYEKVQVRMLAEVFDSTSLIVSKRKLHAQLSSISPLESPIGGAAGREQDLLIHSVLRGATADHEEQLIAIKVRNCMTGVLVVENCLWGAVQCMNVNVKHYSWSHRMFLARALVLLSSFISGTLANMRQQDNQLLNIYCHLIVSMNAEARNQGFLVESLLNGTESV